jgi:hypothetical protein
VFEAGPGRGVVLGAASTAWWIDAGEECIVVETGGSTRPPNGVAPVRPAGARWPVPGDPVEIGHTGMTIGRAEIEIVRWWDPATVLPPTRADDVARRLDASDPNGLRCEAGLEAALHGRDGTGLLEAAHRLLGRGPGLTPEGDDLLIGAVAAFSLIGTAVGDPTCEGLVAAAGDALVRLARQRTTLLSASLLGHACRGRVARPVADYLGALAGGGDVDGSRRRVLSLGHTSGPALTAGVAAGARSVLGGSR